MTFLNVGLGFIGFGAMLLIPAAIFDRAVRHRLLVKATIVGYKQFPNDKSITSNEIFHGVNFRWLRVVEFSDPRTGQALQMFSNPAAADPEPIGTTLTVALDPEKTDPKSDHVLVQGESSAWRSVGKVSLAVGTVLWVVLAFVADTSPLHLIGAFVGFAAVFASGLKAAQRKHDS